MIIANPDGPRSFLGLVLEKAPMQESRASPETEDTTRIGRDMNSAEQARSLSYVVCNHAWRGRDSYGSRSDECKAVGPHIQTLVWIASVG